MWATGLQGPGHLWCYPLRWLVLLWRSRDRRCNLAVMTLMEIVLLGIALIVFLVGAILMLRGQ